MALSIFILLGLIAVSFPIAFALGVAPITALLARDIPLIVIPQTIFESLDSFTLMAIPFFVLAGRLMQTGGIARRLIEFCLALTGWMKGGLASSAVLTTMFFSSICGSSSATAAAIGTVMIPEMERKQYPRSFAASVVASSAELGVILPPSVPMIIYAVLTGTSVTDLFLGGVLPGIMIGLSLIVTIVVVSTLRNFGLVERHPMRVWLRNVARTLLNASLSLAMPVLVLGGIYGGVFTATEAAVVAAVYALILGVFIYKEIPIRALPGIFTDCALTSAIVMLIVAFASVFGYALSVYQAPQAVAALIRGVSDNPLVFLLLVNIFLFAVGLFMETFAAIIILAPVLAPVAVSMGIDPVHFAVIMIVNLAVGMVTPPVGVNLFITCGIAKISMEALLKPLVVFLAVLILNLIIITYVPWLSLVFVH